jgi:aspartate kinase
VAAYNLISSSVFKLSNTRSVSKCIIFARGFYDFYLMKIFKFGGGILSSAEAVKKIPSIIAMFPGEMLLIVVSAFGKTTNALEELVTASYEDMETRGISEKISGYHQEIMQGLFPGSGHPVQQEIKVLRDELKAVLLQARPATKPEFYDRVICFDVSRRFSGLGGQPG